MYKLRNAFIQLTGYWIYKKKHLTTGVDFIIDLENHFPSEFQSIKTVFDIGANSGQSAKKFSTELKSASIYSFEPEAEVFLHLKSNTKHLPNVSCFNFGLGDKNDQMELHHGKYSGWNSLLPDLNDTGKKSMVEIKTLDDFVEETGTTQIDLLKTDTEGFDINVLKGATKMLEYNKIKFIYIEAGFYTTNKRNTNLDEIMSFLLDYNFTLFALYEVSKGGSHMVNGNALFAHSSTVSAKY
jgi:FkbM family methyltransferase